MIRGVIFDLGGTLVDKYSLSPLVNLKKAFLKNNIRLSNTLISRDMGMKKMDHIYHLSKESTFREQFITIYNRPHSNDDLSDIYDDFCKLQNYYLKHHLDIIPETIDTLRLLHKSDIKIGITTGFNKEQMNLCLDFLKKHDIKIDSAVSSSCVNGPSRPDPLMINENMKQMGLIDPKSILKVDDTCVGILEGVHAGCLTVGVARWSINMNVHSMDQKENLDYETKVGDLDYDESRQLVKDKLKKSRLQLHTAEPTYLINTLRDLPYCLI